MRITATVLRPLKLIWVDQPNAARIVEGEEEGRKGLIGLRLNSNSSISTQMQDLHHNNMGINRQHLTPLLRLNSKGIPWLDHNSQHGFKRHLVPDLDLLNIIVLPHQVHSSISLVPHNSNLTSTMVLNNRTLPRILEDRHLIALLRQAHHSQ